VQTTAPTFPRLLLAHAEARPESPAVREKDLGIWQTWTWNAVAQEVREMACGLASLGFKAFDNLAIVGANRPHLYMAVVAAQSLRGVPVPLYQDAVAGEMVFMLQDAGIEFVFVEDQEQVDKLLECRELQKERYPAIRHIIYDDPKGLRHYDQPGLISYEQLRALGREFDQANLGYYDRAVAAGEATDVGVILYTSGTTGRPKGVCQTHASFIAAGRGGVETDRLGPGDNIMSYLPMAWVGDHLFSVAQWLVGGFTLNCPESSETVMNDMREIGPSYYFGPPRTFEGLLTAVSIRMEDAAAPKRWLYAKFMALAQRVGADILNGAPVSTGDRAMYGLGNLLVYGPLRNVLGMSRIRVAYTAGAAIGPDLFRFYRSIGVNLKQFYGQTETCAYVCLQQDGKVKLQTVGTAAPGIELKIADDGEVLVRGVSVLKEYYKRPDATAEVLDANGYFHTGDAGVLDSEGHLRIIDRAKDVGKLVGGAMFAPNYIENKLKFFPADQGSRVLRQCARRGVRGHQHRLRGRGQLGRAARAGLRRLRRPGGQARRAVAHCRVHRQGQRRPRERGRHGPDADRALPGAAQGAGPRRRRAHPHAQGAPRLHRTRNTRCCSTRCTAARPSSSSRPRSSSRTAARAR
jgi:long-chain acyl-CoA synthetase